MCGVSVQVSVLVSETRSHWALGSLNGPGWPVSEPQGPACLHLPRIRITNITTTPGFLHECQGSNSGPPIHTANNLPTKAFPRPQTGNSYGALPCKLEWQPSTSVLRQNGTMTALQSQLPNLMGPPQPRYH